VVIGARQLAAAHPRRVLRLPVAAVPHRPCEPPQVPTPLVLAVIDAAAGTYLILYAVRREQRDKPGVAVTGIFLLLCAAALILIGWPESAGRQPAPLPPPAGTAV
jgi:hypothetical protein